MIYRHITPRHKRIWMWTNGKPHDLGSGECGLKSSQGLIKLEDNMHLADIASLGMTEFGQKYIQLAIELERRLVKFNKIINNERTLFLRFVDQDLTRWYDETVQQLIEAFSSLLVSAVPKYTDVAERLRIIKEWQDQQVRNERLGCPKGLHKVFIGNRLLV